MEFYFKCSNLIHHDKFRFSQETDTPEEIFFKNKERQRQREGWWSWAAQRQARARVHAFARLKETLMKRSHSVDRKEIDGGTTLDAPKNKAAASSVSNYL